MSGKQLSALLRALLATSVIFLFVTGTWASDEKVLRSFGGYAQPSVPSSGLLFDADGNLYGTTHYGNPQGYGPCRDPGCGALFELSPNGRGGWSVTGQCGFGSDNYPDGDYPAGSLTFDAQGSLYGTTLGGGVDGDGTLFSCDPSFGMESMMYSFPGNHDAISPNGGLIWDADGNLYGTSQRGGTYGYGTVFELSRGEGGWTEKVLYSSSFTDGINPLGSLIWDSAGNLYGTTYQGGSHINCDDGYGCGTVFELSPNGSGGWTERVLHNFGSGMDGQNPSSSLTWDSAGNLYGTTTAGGGYGKGTVFEMTPREGGGWTEKVLHNFGSGEDGQNPMANLVWDAAGNLYGTANAGGVYGLGTVFEMMPKEGGGWTEKTLHHFGLYPTDGQNPQSGLIWDASGNLYGTTTGGGAYSDWGICGTVFEITP